MCLPMKADFKVHFWIPKDKECNVCSLISSRLPSNMDLFPYVPVLLEESY